MKPNSNYLIQDHELVQTQQGTELWNEYITQLTEISLQHPAHFLDRVSRVVIPKDAERNHLFALPGDGQQIDAFCIVALYCNTAEYLWAATRKEMEGQGLMGRLYNHIEEHLLDTEPEVEQIIGMCSTLDSKMVLGDELTPYERETRVESWKRTHKFHYGMNFDFAYRLSDYWGEGFHALVFMKPRVNFGKKRRRDCQVYGYTKLPEIDFNLSPSTQKADKHPTVNQKVQKQIRKYLDAFDESFIRNVQPGTLETEKHVFQTKSGPCLKGFTGLAMINPHLKTAVAFAQTSAKPRPALFKMRFEYSTESSAFLKLLTSPELTEPTGFLVYRSDLDANSELNISSFFDTFYETLGDTDYTIFYSRRRGLNGHYSVLYFVTPRITNIVWYKNLWDSFAKYSFALMLATYSYFSSLRVHDASLHDNDYFDTLMQAVAAPETDDNGDDFLGKIYSLEEDIKDRTTEQYQAMLRFKESAIVHYGHSLGNRLSPIQAYLDGRQSSLNRAVANTKFLGDLSVVLQAVNLASTDEIFRHPKKTRFLEYEREGGHLNITEKIQNEWPMLAESYQPARVAGDDAYQIRVMTMLEFTRSLQNAHLDFMLFDSEDKEFCRPREAFYSQLFSELLLNVVRYGGIPNDKIDLQNRTARVLVELSTMNMTNVSKVAPNPCPVLVLVNMVGDEPPTWISRNNWSLWPADRENDGPGMAIAVLRRLALGELWYFYDDAERLFGVAVWLAGLVWEKAPAH